MIPHAFGRGRFLSLLLSVTGLLAFSGHGDEKAAGAGRKLFVIGASASAGFLQQEIMGGVRTPEYRLKYYLDAALKDPHEPVESATSSLFFLAVPTVAREQIDKAMAAQPAVVIGIDFLFWFCYGRRPEDLRPAMLEDGLTLLEQIKGPLVIGDIPDASSAVGGILHREEMPKLETIAAANRRIREWAAERPAVMVLPLADFMVTCKADQPLKTGPVEWPQGTTRKLLQPDQLHAGRTGNVALALSIMAALTERGLIAKDNVRWDAEAVKAQAILNAAPEIEEYTKRTGKKESRPSLEVK